MVFQHFIRHFNTKQKQMAGILAKGSFLCLSGMMRLVNVCAPPSDKFSVRSPSQGSKNSPHKALFSGYVPMLQKKESQLEHRHDVVKFAFKMTKSKGFLDVDLSRSRERSRCGDNFSRKLRDETLASSHQDGFGKERREAPLHKDLHRKWRRETFRREPSVTPTPGNQLRDETTTH